MNSHIQIVQWATDTISSQGYPLEKPPLIILETPWPSRCDQFIACLLVISL